MQINSAKRRKGISPVLATVILIAITLIAAIAIAGFVFGLFGSFTSTARVELINPALTHGTGVANTGTVGALNTGTSNTNAASATLTFGGATCSATITGSPVTLTAGATTTLTVTGVAGCGTSVSGETFILNVALSNGGQTSVTGTFS